MTEAFQHTAARRRLEPYIHRDTADTWFQHTAARRRLVINYLMMIYF